MGFEVETEIYYYDWHGSLVMWTATEVDTERAIFEDVVTGKRTTVYYHGEIIRELNELEVLAWASK